MRLEPRVQWGQWDVKQFDMIFGPKHFYIRYGSEKNNNNELRDII